MAGRAPRGSVGVRELRQNISVYLDRVKKGEVLTVTEHGAAVAILRPLPRGGSVLDRLVAEGRARPPLRSIPSLPKPLPLRLDRPLSALIEDDREDRL
ncbi:MAG TPA: type II toxin-antitoxin system prevent-host-death family antitoxin [Vicinamibacterales bacterium]|nr:type II toxin-antitoxin system prevent-host-death family antitoxin [Vicinamibacterales bacterium]